MYADSIKHQKHQIQSAVIFREKFGKILKNNFENIITYIPRNFRRKAIAQFDKEMYTIYNTRS